MIKEVDKGSIDGTNALKIRLKFISQVQKKKNDSSNCHDNIFSPLFSIFSSPDPTNHVWYCHHMNWRPSQSVNFYILIFFTGTRLGMNVHWIVSQRFFFPLIDRKYTKETRGPKKMSERMSSVSILFSETTGPIGTKSGRNVQCIVIQKVYVSGHLVKGHGSFCHHLASVIC